MQNIDRILEQELKQGYIQKDELFRGQEVFINCVDFRNGIRPHAHDFIEIAFVAHGTAMHCREGREERVSRGDLLLINTDVQHAYEPMPNDRSTVRIYNCTFVPRFFDFSLLNSRHFADVTRHFLFHSFLGQDISDHARVSLEETAIHQVESLFKNMLREFTEQEVGWVEMIRAGTIELLIHYLRALRSCGFGMIRQDSIDDQLFRQVVDHIERNYSSRIRLEDLSMMALLSPNYFCAKFHEYTGLTFVEFVQRTRIEAASGLLRTTNRKVPDIAGEVGYHDLRHFNRLFKRLVGCSPTDLRRNAR